MKYSLLGIGIAFLFATPAHALTSTSITSHNAPAVTTYSYKIDVLVLDVTVKPETGSDVLAAFTVDNIGSPTQNRSVAKMKLWRDAGTIGYHGWEEDTLLGEVTSETFSTWAFYGLNVVVPADGVRLFVTMDTARSIVRSAVQLEVSQLYDSNKNGQYNEGDSGVFFTSTKNGLTDIAVLNSDRQIISPSTSIATAPQSVITTPTHGSAVVVGTPLTIQGKARGRGGLSASVVEIRIGVKQEIEAAVWKRVPTTSDSISQWEYSWTPSLVGTMHIDTRVADSNGVTEEAHGIDIVVSPKPVFPSDIPPVDPYQGALVRTVDSSAVYYIYNAARFVFPNEKIYYSWYQDFRTVKTVSGSELATWRIAGVVTYRPGTRLIKLQTDPKVYAVSKGGVLRFVSTQPTAQKLFGSGWATLIDDLNDSFFSSYTVGEPLDENTHFSLTEQRDLSTTIGQDKSL